MQEMCKQKSKKAANTIAQATKTTDPTIKVEKKIYQYVQINMNQHMLKVHGMHGGKKKVFLKQI